MARLLVVLLGLLLGAGFTCGQDEPLRITRVNGLDGKPWPVKVKRSGPDIETFDAPYVLTPGASSPALWFLDRDQCVPVAYSATGKRVANFEVVHSGNDFFLTYVTDGANEFWRLKGDKASRVTVDGLGFSQRARITRGGDAAYIYTGDFAGKTGLYEVKEGVASALKLDSLDRGTISFAWAVGGRLLAAFYKEGTYDFHALRDGSFAPAWERNAEQDFDRQVDSISEIWAGERLFLDIKYRDASRGAWVFDGAKLEAVQQHWGDAPVANEHGVYFIDGALKLADGTRVQEIKLPGKATSLSCRGGSVLANGEKAWLVSGSSVVELPAGAELVAYAGGADVLRVDGKLQLYRAGKDAGEVIIAKEFGLVERALRHGSDAYLLERTTDAAFRLWYLR